MDCARAHTHIHSVYVYIQYVCARTNNKFICVYKYELSVEYMYMLIL